jgi:uroporphyrin-III C-methyltransferase/precorrin-2 dehydrogenase/sirohydrochlorin ferrochelatase/uroporphyrin-III C-methyltransferase
MPAQVYLTGAGPGDPELLTLKAARLIAAADVILHDSLVDARIIALARPGATCIDVGKRCGLRSTSQEDINRLLVEYARAGNIVVRLKGGDPMIFGRATEEFQALDAYNIPYEIIPGVTAATAAAAALGLSLTRRKIARSVHFLTGHGAEDGLPAHDWVALSRAGGTLVIYMGRDTVSGLAAHLIEAGMPPDMPAAAVENVSLPDQHILLGTIASLPRCIRARGGNAPTLILVGEALDNENKVGLQLRGSMAIPSV